MKPFNRILSLLFPIVFAAAGIFLIVISADKIIKVANHAYTPATAVVDHIDSIPASDPQDSDSETVYVRYTVGGTEYLEYLSESPNDVKVGDTINIIYETAHPEKVTIPGTTGAYIRIGLGVIAILAGIVMFFRALAGR